MPQYEIAMIIRPATKTQMAECIKRYAEAVFKNGGLIKRFENLGQRPLPYTMKYRGEPVQKGNYFVMYFDLPGANIISFKRDTKGDQDIIRRSILRSEQERLRPCEVGECYFDDMNNDKILNNVLKFGTFTKRTHDFDMATRGIRMLQQQANIKKKHEEE
ncbi:probable 28S ribosomal protein S6, mitochondrial [Lingula anatina]|uniref:Small ribosomal subunit protein bS6m n=1 Tax=Lingula anatina TaxID=7574 RepID=A0A1S3JZB2_LINAN|nr:probable 28S ribosomal protein S6, mitochondrial [Lingula anatina]|eukprot:XP_013415371.1 probable 28S ribosomal protein S6, mitochondrial [Lingula anatina]